MALHVTKLIKPIFMLFTVVFYGVLICVLLKGRKAMFNSSFYALFVSTGIADMLNLLQRVFMMDLPTLFFVHKWLKLSHKLPLATISNGFSWYITYVQILGLVAITINRFSAVALPVWFKKFWTHDKLNLKIILAAQWILPMLCLPPMFTSCCHAIYLDDDMSDFDFASEKISAIYSIIDSIIEVLFCAPLVIILNILTVVISVKNRHQLSNIESEMTNERKRAELRLAVVGIIISVSYVSSVVFISLTELAGLNVLPHINADIMSNWYYNSFDTFTLCNPYILLVLSSVTRTAFLRFVTCKGVAIEPNRPSITLSTNNLRRNLRLQRV